QVGEISTFGSAKTFNTNIPPRLNITSVNTRPVNANFFKWYIFQGIIRMLLNKNFGVKLQKVRSDFQTMEAQCII
ncbi:MAG: hypothetical protein QOD15_11065, partial [Nitrososphaeraceae archaeon]|nr:hypothetical protein [Nitrososphaeraceae archaeon]